MNDPLSSFLLSPLQVKNILKKPIGFKALTICTAQKKGPISSLKMDI